MQFVKIYLATATFDKIEKDEKVTTEAALGLIGGTMGLFTGFSILGVEIIYYLIKCFMSLRLIKADFKKRYENHLRNLRFTTLVSTAGAKKLLSLSI